MRHKVYAFSAFVLTLVAVTGCAVTVESDSPELPPDIPSGQAANCEYILPMIVTNNPPTYTVEEIDTADLSLPGGLALPPADCSFVVVDPAEGGQYDVLVIYLSEDPERVPLLQQRMTGAGYQTFNQPWTSRDASNNLFSITTTTSSALGYYEANEDEAEIVLVTYIPADQT